MNIIYNFSKTSYQLVSRCNEKTQMEQKSLGYFVLLTAVFAFISGYYALISIFGEWDPVRNQYYMSHQTQVVTVVIAFLYAMMICMIDREIVSAKTKLTVLLRIPLAIIIGVVIAVPLKLKILEDRIHQKIYENQGVKVAPFTEQRNQLIKTIDTEIREIEIQIAYYVNQYNDARSRARDEDLGRAGSGLTGLAGRGTFYNYAREEEESHRGEIERLEKLKTEKINYREQRIKEIEQDLKFHNAEPVYGLWEKYIVMTQIVREDSSGKAKWMVFSLSVLFILFELIPSLIKLLSPKNDYDKLTNYNSELIDKKLDYCLNNVNHTFEHDDFLDIPEIRIKYDNESKKIRKIA